jgi:hypothetical protein
MACPQFWQKKLAYVASIRGKNSPLIMKPIAFLYVHGLGLPESINQDAENMKRCLSSKLDQRFEFAHVNYAELFQSLQTNTTTMLKSLPHNYFALGFKYFNSEDFRLQVYGLIKLALEDLASRLGEECENTDLMMICYSFGTIITPEFLSVFASGGFTDGYFGPGSMILLKNLKLICTMGCPYSWFCPERPIRGSIALDPGTFKSIEMEFQWVNLYYSSDVLATPLAILSPQFHYVCDRQIPFDAESPALWKTLSQTLLPPFKMTPASHLLYPQDPFVHDILVEQITQLSLIDHVLPEPDMVRPILEPELMVTFHAVDIPHPKFHCVLYVHGMGDSDQYRKEAHAVYEQINAQNLNQSNTPIQLITFDYSSLIVESSRQHDLLEHFEEAHASGGVDLKWLRSYVLSACPVTMGYMGNSDTQQRIHQAFDEVMEQIQSKFSGNIGLHIISYSLGSVVALKYLASSAWSYQSIRLGKREGPRILGFYTAGAPLSWMLEANDISLPEHIPKWTNYYYPNDPFCGALLNVNPDLHPSFQDVALKSKWNPINEVFACFNALYLNDQFMWEHLFNSLSDQENRQ